MLDVDEMSDEVRKNLGVVSMPGTPFVGGHDLVMWNHSHHKPAVIKLIQHLHSEEANRELYPLYGLPVSESAWENPPFDTVFYPVFKTGIQNGRGFRGNLWGLVEKRLTDEYADIWNEILKSSEDQLDSIVSTHLKNLSGRLQLSVQS
jgi:ABC-type glycerol-3-phosphate transport system substrate-binding protein